MRRFLPIAAAVLLVWSASAQEVLRGAFAIELEPVSSMKEGDPYPLDQDTAGRRALDEAAFVFAAMIYGWDFSFSIGDKSRAAAEYFDAVPLGSIQRGDGRLSVTDAETEDSMLRVWAEYRMDDAQARVFAAAREGAARQSQGTGSGALSAGQEGKAAALKDAARLAVRVLLGGTERSRPKEALGKVVLLEAPRYWIDQGRYQCLARFLVVVKEIIPYRYF